MSSQNELSCCLSVEGLESIYSNPSEQEGPFCDCTSGSWALSQLQASDIHLHPIIEGKDGGGAGAVGPLFHITNGLIEVFPTRQTSNRQGGGT